MTDCLESLLARFWASQTGGILTEYEALRHRHLDLVGQSVAVAAAPEEPSASGEGEKPEILRPPRLQNWNPWPSCRKPSELS